MMSSSRIIEPFFNAVPPRSGPDIRGLQTYYFSGDVVEAECVTKDSNPAPKFSWKLNGKKVE